MTKYNIKFYFLISILYIVSSSFIFFDDERNIQFIPYEYVPENARNFIEEYFSAYEVHNSAYSSGNYIVTFKGGSSIHFSQKGEWKNIIGNRKIIPINIAEKFINNKIINIIKERYTDINSIYKKRKGLEFKVDDSYYIYIDNEGNIIKIKKA
ncbi:PepSY-like domain-containing protein [Brachyspira pulli]|uniref:PepSY-like domain-containing protein n=1 Tax=Brachyspira pulli TaxID=310721 RepID=UPI00300623B5